MQLEKVVSFLPDVPKFDVNQFIVRRNKLLGAGAFGYVHPCSFFKVQCVMKLAKNYKFDELMLEIKILAKLHEHPLDERQKFLPFLFGFHELERGLIVERFYGKTIKQWAKQKEKNDWRQRVLQLCRALNFMHERQVNQWRLRFCFSRSTQF